MNNKVAIWGSYDHGNYGDDIMAIMISNYLLKLGNKPIVYRINSKLADRYKLDYSDNLLELVESTELCLIGGGGMLVSENILRIIFRKNTWDFEKDFKHLYKAIKKHNRICYGISIGGDDKTLFAMIPYWRRRFLKSLYFKRATVRLINDLNFAEKLNFEAIYYPDILLSIPRFFNINYKPKNRSSQIKIGLNLFEKNAKQLISMIVKSFSNHEFYFYFINSHLPVYNFSYESKAPEGIPNFNNYQYCEPHELVNFIANLDLLVSSKLHLGVTALSVGVPFLSYSGKSKTKAFLNDIDAKFAICNKANEVIDIIKQPDAFKLKYNWDLIKRKSKESYLHFEFIGKIVNENTSNT